MVVAKVIPGPGCTPMLPTVCNAEVEVCVAIQTFENVSVHNKITVLELLVTLSALQPFKESLQQFSP